MHIQAWLHMYMFSFPTFPSINQILNTIWSKRQILKWKEWVQMCHGPGFCSLCVDGGGCLWNFWQLSGREQPAETRALSLVCLEQKEARSHSGPHRGFICNHTPTTRSLSRSSTLFSGLRLSLCYFFRQITAQISESNLCYRNTIWFLSCQDPFVY